MKKREFIISILSLSTVKNEVKQIEEDVIFRIIHVIDNIFQILSFLAYFHLKYLKNL